MIGILPSAGVCLYLVVVCKCNLGVEVEGGGCRVASERSRKRMDYEWVACRDAMSRWRAYRLVTRGGGPGTIRRGWCVASPSLVMNHG
ncbi:hypothetical protein BZA05DRAFT_387336 [Tricharina praecox]|uniref:uncharacterized protein n=1 Tax=Tricharina praecox TaxID=43433 RepID=UPI00221FA5BD|nr:uncharacterized protein BZA05DRAFT_387336 [Tricharina praecox]KAI5857130.1 hypothetical protein BZA05DRAFT_387336 [Tricharina praecox]